MTEEIATQLYPVSNKLESVERSSQYSSASISSLASDVSRILELVSASPARSERSDLETSGFLSSPQPEKYEGWEWCCDSLSGIEGAFSDQRSGREVKCMFCKEHFDLNATDWYDRGKHLAETHRYGQCNLSLSYHYTSRFRSHMINFHDMTSNDTGFVSAHQREVQVNRFQRGPHSNWQAQHVPEETSESSGIYHAQLKALLHEFSNTKQDSAPDDSLYRATSLTARQQLLEAGIACLQERFIVDGHILNFEDDRPITSETSQGIARSISEALFQTRKSIIKDSMDRTEKVNEWLLEVLRHSTTNRIILRD